MSQYYSMRELRDRLALRALKEYVTLDSVEEATPVQEEQMADHVRTPMIFPVGLPGFSYGKSRMTKGRRTHKPWGRTLLGAHRRQLALTS